MLPECVDQCQFIGAEVFIFVVNLLATIIFRVIHIFVVKDNAFLILVRVDVVKVKRQLAEMLPQLLGVPEPCRIVTTMTLVVMEVR